MNEVNDKNASDELPPNECEGGDTQRGGSNMNEVNDKNASDELPPNECEGAIPKEEEAT